MKRSRKYLRTLPEARARERLSQRELADRAGLTQAVISYIENGYHSPHPRTKENLEFVLGQSIDWNETVMSNTLWKGVRQ